jgi:hypothetical protein
MPDPQPCLNPDPETTAELAASTEPLAAAPNSAVADLWRMTPGLYLPDGTAIYGPHSIAERNETYEVAEYAPGWVLIGDDGGGLGYLMRAAAGPARGREAAEVYRLDLGALSEDVEADGEFVTDDLCGWLAGNS